MPSRGRVFLILGTLMIAAMIAMNVGWVLTYWRTGVIAILGASFSLIVIGGLVLFTIFLVREVRRNDQQNAFINAVTHELKTPVASIRLYLETLQRHDLDETKRLEFYRRMLTDSNRLLHTIEQVLQAGQAGASRRSRPLQMLDVSELVRDAVDMAQRRHHVADGAITLDSAFPDPTNRLVLGDEDELKAALSNLLDNAVKYSGEVVRVRVAVSADTPKRIAVRVHDTGVGIPSEELRRIFKRFYRGPHLGVKRVKGTGLGLYIVRSVAQRHGGKVFAESAGAGQGSTFTLQLPLAEDAPPTSA